MKSFVATLFLCLTVLFAFAQLALAIPGTDFTIGDDGISIELQPSGKSSTFRLAISNFQEVSSQGVVVREVTFGNASISSPSDEEKYVEVDVVVPFSISNDAGTGNFDYAVRVYKESDVIQWGDDDIKIDTGALKSNIGFEWVAPENPSNRFRIIATLQWSIATEDVAKCLGKSVLNQDFDPKFKSKENNDGKVIGYEIDACIKGSIEFPGDIQVNGTEFQEFSVDSTEPSVSLNSQITITIEFGPVSACDNDNCFFEMDPIFQTKSSASTLVHIGVAFLLSCLILLGLLF